MTGRRLGGLKLDYVQAARCWCRCNRFEFHTTPPTYAVFNLLLARELLHRPKSHRERPDAGAKEVQHQRQAQYTIHNSRHLAESVLDALRRDPIVDIYREEASHDVADYEDDDQHFAGDLLAVSLYARWVG